MHDYFITFARPYLRNRIEVPKDDIEAINDFAKRMVPKLKQELKYRNLSDKTILKNVSHGKIAEVAVEKFTKTKFVNFKINEAYHGDEGDLYYYDNLKVGVKTAEFGNLPLVYRNDKGGCKDPEIITIFERPNFVYICGYATIPMLNYYQDPKFSFGDAVYKKAGFWGFHKLHNFTSMDDIKQLSTNKTISDFNEFFDVPEDYGFRKIQNITEISIC